MLEGAGVLKGDGSIGRVVAVVAEKQRVMPCEEELGSRVLATGEAGNERRTTADSKSLERGAY